VLAQEGAQLFGRNWGRGAILVLEDQPPLVRTQPIPRDRLGTPAMAIRPMPIEVHEVIVPPAQVLT
jgi:hypothetical protein